MLDFNPASSTCIADKIGPPTSTAIVARDVEPAGTNFANAGAPACRAACIHRYLEREIALSVLEEHDVFTVIASAFGGYARIQLVGTLVGR